MLHTNNPMRRAGWITAAGLGCWMLLVTGNGLSPSPESANGRRRAPFATPTRLATWSDPISALDGPREEEPMSVPQPLNDPIAGLNDVIDEIDSAAADALDATLSPEDRMAADMAALARNQQRLLDDLATLREELKRDDPAVEWKQRFETFQRIVTQLAAVEPGLTGAVAELQGEIAQMRVALESLDQPIGVEVEPELLTTKLYRLVRVRKEELQPLIEKLLTPGIGLWAAAENAEEQSTAILVRDRPEAIGQVDRLISELDRPLFNIELDVSTLSIDMETRKPLSEPRGLSPGLIRRDGKSFLILESLLFPDSAAPDCDEWLEPLVDDGRGPRRLDRSRSSQRVIRITPRVTH